MRIRQGRRRGFTLVEILVVIAIIATLASAVVLTISRKPEEAKVAKAKGDIAQLESVLEVFRIDMGRYPSDEEGLQSLITAPDTEDATRWKGPYLKRLEKDPWGRDYIFVTPGERNPDGFDLMSYGANGEEGGEGEFDADIGNWREEEEEGESTAAPAQ